MQDLAAFFAGLKRIESLTSDSLLLKFSLVRDDIQPSSSRCSALSRLLRQRSDVMSRKLYVGNLPYEVGEDELQQLFAQAGTVESVKVMRDQASGRPRGFAFVEMGSDEEAQSALKTLNAVEVGGRNLTVNEARPKAERSGGFGGGQSQRRRSEPRW